MEGGREDGKEGRRTRRRRSGYRTKNKNPTRQCGEQWTALWHNRAFGLQQITTP